MFGRNLAGSAGVLEIEVEGDRPEESVEESREERDKEVVGWLVAVIAGVVIGFDERVECEE